MKRILLSICCFAVVGLLKAQQRPSSDHYLIQQYMINPAAAGRNGTSLLLDYRKQWAGFTGAPETQTLAVDGTVHKEQIGLGLLVVNDQVNILGSTGAMATFAYRVKLEEKHFLRLGLSAGINQNRILFDKVIADDPSELQVFQSNQNATSFDAAGGLYYEFKNLNVGIAVSNLFGEHYFYENNFKANSLKYQNIRHYLINAQYRFDFKNGKWGIMPAALVRAAQGLAPAIEGGVTGYYKNDAWLTLRYINKIGYSVGVGGVIAKNIVLGYAYTLSSNSLGSFNNGTHDIILGFKMGAKNSTKSDEQKALEDLKNKNNELFEKTDFLKSENDALRKELEEQKRILKQSIYGLDSLKKHMMENQPELNKIIKENQELFDKLPEHGHKSNDNSSSTTFGNSSNSNSKSNNSTESNSKAKSKNAKESKGNSSATEANSSNSNSESIDYGKIYVVLGASKTLEVAKEFQQIVLREYGEETKIIRDASDTWYFVYTKIFEDYKEAHLERDRTEKLDTKGIFVGNTWCYITKK